MRRFFVPVFFLLTVFVCVACTEKSGSAEAESAAATDPELSEEVLPVSVQVPEPEPEPEPSVHVVYDAPDRKSLSQEVAPGVYEGNRDALLHRFDFTPEELGERLVLGMTDKGYMSAVIYNEDMETAFFSGSANSQFDAKHLSYNYFGGEHQNVTCVRLESDQFKEELYGRCLFLFRDDDTDEVFAGTVLDCDGTMGLFYEYDGLFYYGDMDDAYTDYAVRYLCLRPDLQIDPNAILGVMTKPMLLPYVQSQERSVRSYEEGKELFLTGRTGHAVGSGADAEYWFCTEKDRWLPASVLTLYEGTFNALPVVDVPDVEILATDLWVVTPKESDGSVPYYTLPFDERTKSECRIFCLHALTKLSVTGSDGSAHVFYECGYPVRGLVSADSVSETNLVTGGLRILSGYGDVLTVTAKSGLGIARTMPLDDAPVLSEFDGRVEAVAVTDDGWYLVYLSPLSAYGWFKKDSL